MTTSKSIITTVLTGTLAAGFLLTTAVPSEAGWRDRQRSGTATGPKGNQSSFQQWRNRSAGQASRGTTWQNRNGEGSRSANRNWNREQGTASKDRQTKLANGKESSARKSWKRNDDGSVSSSASRTGYNGKTSSREGTTAKTENGRTSSGTWQGKNGNTGTYQSDVVKTDTGYQKVTTVTDQNGQSATYNKDVNQNADGSWTTNKGATGPNGQSASSSKTTIRTANGRSTAGTYSTSNGKSGTFKKDVSNAPGERNKSTSVTNQDGTTVGRDVNKRWDSTGGSKTVTRTNPDGTTDSRTSYVDIDAPEVESAPAE